MSAVGYLELDPAQRIERLCALLRRGAEDQHAGLMILVPVDVPHVEDDPIALPLAVRVDDAAAQPQAREHAVLHSPRIRRELNPSPQAFAVEDARHVRRQGDGWRRDEGHFGWSGGRSSGLGREDQFCTGKQHKRRA